IERALPDVDRREEPVGERGSSRHLRLSGGTLPAFAEKWGLLARRDQAAVPASLFTAPLPVVSAYLPSIFQAEGALGRGGSGPVTVALAAPRLARGLQQLLLRFGIFARLAETGGRWTLTIADGSDREAFAREIGMGGPAAEERPAA